MHQDDGRYYFGIEYVLERDVNITIMRAAVEVDLNVIVSICCFLVCHLEE